MRNKPAQKKIAVTILATASLCALVLLFVVVRCALAPSGAYNDPYISGEGGVYWVLDNGQVYLRNKDWSELVGKYSKSNNIWIMNDAQIIESSVIGLRVVSQNEPTNRFLYRRGLGWLRPKN